MTATISAIYAIVALEQLTFLRLSNIIAYDKQCSSFCWITFISVKAVTQAHILQASVGVGTAQELNECTLTRKFTTKDA